MVRVYFQLLEVGTCYLRMIIHTDWVVGGVGGVGPYSSCPGEAERGGNSSRPSPPHPQPTTSSGLQGHREGAPETDGQPQLIWRRQTVNSSEVTPALASHWSPGRQLAPDWPSQLSADVGESERSCQAILTRVPHRQARRKEQNSCRL